MKLKIAELERMVQKALRHYGYDPEETAQLAEVLLYAQLRGNNQGISKLIGRGLPKDPAAGTIQIVRETKLSVLLDGNRSPGIVVMVKAMELALAKARASGFGLAGTHNTDSSTGAIGYYARKIAEAGFVGFAFAGSPQTVSPHGSYQPLFGTNPLAIGIPATARPIVFDMATSAMAFYGLVEANAAGRSIPGDVAYDANGNLTTDPAQAMDGAIRPFDRGYKGSGLALMVEILTGPLVGAAFAGLGDSWHNWGNLILVLDPELLVDGEAFKRDVDRLIEEVKGAKKLPGVAEIHLPGERGDRLAQQHLDAGEIEVEDNLCTELKQIIGETAAGSN
jgi:L-2-hydroxycarboxylate dehydrogenase (NAD+)